MEYVGEVLDEDEYQRRKDFFLEVGQRHYYFMNIGNGEVIDASRKVGWGRRFTLYVLAAVARACGGRIVQFALSIALGMVVQGGVVAEAAEGVMVSAMQGVAVWDALSIAAGVFPGRLGFGIGARRAGVCDTTRILKADKNSADFPA